ncbi:50S ribosomal protein L21 [Candidatus Providencia siddallii]|uniref:Large ribosomal subunit protein bL21 n=1 Tax=Candidatus Providencia siddallii TaxID=1715285 RepID=A0A0M6W9D6_9GAMM|nr:50S ribosomal protein L21 [Candidatus Providencia siddallii]
MYAVFQNGGKQYMVKEGQILRLEKLNIAIGTFIDFNDVLIVNNGVELKIGTPIINNYKIKAEVIAHGRNEKIKIIKFKRRKHSRKHQGHRQYFTDVKITRIF